MPYQKNDNTHVEQKNDDKARKLVDYYRYDTQHKPRVLNLLYEKSDLLDNFFIASAKLSEKIRDDKCRVIRRVHNNMIELRKQINKTLQDLYESTNAMFKENKYGLTREQK